MELEQITLNQKEFQLNDLATDQEYALLQKLKTDYLKTFVVNDKNQLDIVKMQSFIKFYQNNYSKFYKINIQNIIGGHQSRVSKCMFCPNGQYFFTASIDGSVKYWTTDDFQLIQTLEFDGPVEFLMVTNDSSKMIVGFNNEIIIRGIYQEKDIVQIKLESKVKFIIFNDTQTQIVIGQEEGLSIYLLNGIIQWNIKTNQIVSTANLSCDQKFLIVGYYNGQVEIWDIFSTPSGESQENLFHRFQVNKFKITNIINTKSGQKYITTDEGGFVTQFKQNDKKFYIQKQVHSCKINNIFVLNDGQKFITLGSDQKCKVISQEFEILNELEGNIIVNLNESQKIMVLGSLDNKIRYYNNSTFTLISIVDISLDCKIDRVYVSPQKETIVLQHDIPGDDSKLFIYDFNELKQLYTLQPGHKWITTMDISCCGKFMVTGNKDGLFKIFKSQDSQEWNIHQSYNAHDDHITAVLCAQDSNIDQDMIVFSASFDKTIKVWKYDQQDLWSPSQIQYDNIQVTTSMCFSKNFNILITAGDMGLIILFDATQNFKQIGYLKAHKGQINSVSLSFDQNKLVSASKDRTIKIWNILTRTNLAILEGHRNSVTNAKFNTKQKYLISVSLDDQIKIWHHLNYFCIRTIRGHNHSITSLVISNDGLKFATGCENGTIKVWNGLTFTCDQTIDAHFKDVNQLKYSIDGEFLISASFDSSLKVWSAQQNLQRFLISQSDIFLCIDKSSDFKHVATGGADCMVKIWNIASQQLKVSLDSHSAPVTSVVYSPVDPLLFSGSLDCTIKIWNNQTYQLLETLNKHLEGVLTIQISQNGQQLFTGGYDECFMVWSIQFSKKEYQLVKKVQNPENKTVSSIAQNQNNIAVGSWDNLIRMYFN